MVLCHTYEVKNSLWCQHSNKITIKYQSLILKIWNEKCNKNIKTRLINILTKIHSHAYPFYVTLVLRHFLPSFWKQSAQQTQILVIHVCWWQMSGYVIAWKNDNAVNLVLLSPRWGARGWFAIRFCMDSRDETIRSSHDTYRYEGRRYGYFRYDTDNTCKNAYIHNIHILLFMNTTEECFN